MAASSARLILAGATPRTFGLDSAPVTIGRGPGNDIPVQDLRASRLHARIEPGPEGFVLADAGSQNGTWRNGERCERSVLHDGDVIQIGSTQLVFREGGEADATIDGAGSNGLETVSEVEPDLARRFRRVATLIRVMSTHAGSDRFFEQLIDAAVELTSAERGFLIMNAREGMQFLAARNIGQEDRKDPAFEVSWSIAVRVGTSGEGVLLVDAQSDDRFSAKESVEQLGLRSILCLPIRSTAGVQGVIYLDNRVQSGAFTKEDRDVMEVLADQAGVVLEQERLSTDLRKRQQEVEDLNSRLKTRVSEQDSEINRMRHALRAGSPEETGFAMLIGGSARMDEMRALLVKIAACDLPVLVYGESGTGKELVARAIHSNSDRAGAELVTVNCAAFPETLLENELFGHVRGAYTGADRSKKGLFEAAHGGTLFLDEVASMSQAMQIRLLRVLQDGEIRPVGAPSSVRVNVRVVAASNQELKAMVAAGTFREDLYYRLRVLQVIVPPLRERREDIPALVAHFLEKHGFNGVTVSPDALDALGNYAWPGNVRELENELRRASVVGGPTITREGLSRHIVESTKLLVGEDSSFHDLGELVKSVESREIEKALRRSEGNKTRAAHLLGISRFTLQRKLDKYGIAADEDT
jgi:transcriptional regulator with PAS, ATPase and Fis domain/pSer/pThr/pTyr-binding forkhead associated (FHA) protein